MMRLVLSIMAIGFGAMLAVSQVSANDQKQVRSTAVDQWIQLTGTVKKTVGDEFTLDYGKGEIQVEMDDMDKSGNNVLLFGDKVVVTGRMDRDFHEKRSIEASSVYLPRLEAYFYASPADEEAKSYFSNLQPKAQAPDFKQEKLVAITGTVRSMEGETMTVFTGYRTYQVDVGNVPGVAVEKTVSVGDHVTVSGEIDKADLFDRGELEASQVTVIANSRVE